MLGGAPYAVHAADESPSILGKQAEVAEASQEFTAQTVVETKSNKPLSMATGYTLSAINVRTRTFDLARPVVRQNPTRLKLCGSNSLAASLAIHPKDSPIISYRPSRSMVTSSVLLTPAHWRYQYRGGVPNAMAILIRLEKIIHIPYTFWRHNGMDNINPDFRSKWKTIRPWIVAALSLPLAIHIVFKISAPTSIITAEWSAGEILDYVGSLLGALATIVALRWTILEERNGRAEEQRLAAIPCMAITSLERNTVNSLFDFNNGSNRQDSSLPSSDKYVEYELQKEYIVVSKGVITYQSRLTDEQQNKVVHGNWMPERISENVRAVVANDSIYLPLVLHSVGNGPAINVSVHLEKNGVAPTSDHNGCPSQLSPKQLLVGNNRYVGILIDERMNPLSNGDYALVISYCDVMGHKYLQKHELTITTERSETSGQSPSSFDFKIDAVLVE